MKTIAYHQNASCMINYIAMDKNINKNVLKALASSSYDLSTDTSIRTNSDLIQKVDTFENDGYCALILLPKRKSLFDIFLKPFDL